MSNLQPTTFAPRSFEYAVVDVFAERPLEGNALAVFTDARGLSTAEMQSIARETNLCDHSITRATAESGAHWHDRMQFYGGEDPATGSASGCTIAYLVHYGLEPSDQPVVLEQGAEMLRPSRIYVQATSAGGQVGNVRVGGRTIPIASGRFFLP